MKNQKMSYTLEAFYQLDGPLDMELDKSIRAEIPKYIKKWYNTSCKWFYQEFTFGGEDHDYRLIGFDIGRDTSEIEQLDIINDIRVMSDGVVMVRFHEYPND
jgi:hypothetical protein